MATRSTIALEHADGTVSQIYCHWDGYLENNGSILLKHYQDPAKVAQLMTLGDLSSLNTELGERQDFDRPNKGQCLAYGRDRGEAGCEARKFSTFGEYIRKYQPEEYNYIMRRDGKWYVEFYGYFNGLLTEAFEFQAKQREEEEME